MERTLIVNKYLTADMKRTRSGSSQLFRRRGLDNKFTTEGNADVVLVPERRELYADLIDGEWYWVNGCAECNGKPRDWGTYIECEKHNVCRTCKTPRSEIKESPWGGKCGWQCRPCADTEKVELKQQALAKVNEKEYDESDYNCNDNVICPHCGTSYEPDCEVTAGEETCELCGGEYSLEVEYSVQYSTTVIGERIRS